MRIARCEQKLSQDNIYIHITKGQLLDLNSGISKDELVITFTSTRNQNITFVATVRI